MSNQVTRLDIVASLRRALATGHARHDGEAQLAGRRVERIRWTLPNCPFRHCEDHPVFAYVDPQTLYPIRIDGYLVTDGVPGHPTPILSHVVTRFLTYEYLPRTAANLALTDIHAQHPDATNRYS